MKIRYLLASMFISLILPFQAYAGNENSLFDILFGNNTSSSLSDEGNRTNDSFSKAKKMLEREVYSKIEKKTIYCNFDFDSKKNVKLVDGFYTDEHKKRSYKIEWEHVVPAENFGRTFSEWRDGHQLCVDNKGRKFKGRKCAEKVNMEYRYMQSDMYNLYPAVGSVNASRLNYNFVQFEDNVPSSFGICEMKIYDRKAEPPDYAKGKVARAYLYMENTYSRYKMSKSQRNLMIYWNNTYPVTKDECKRTKLIERLQGNENNIVKKLCIENNIW